MHSALLSDWCQKGSKLSRPFLMSFTFYLHIEIKEESRRADSNRLPLLITSVRSVVAGHCTELRIPHRKRVLCSLYCPLLQGIACGLGSN